MKTPRLVRGPILRCSRFAPVIRWNREIEESGMQRTPVVLADAESHGDLGRVLNALLL